MSQSTTSGRAVDPHPAPGSHRILTIPNVVTLVRLCCLPLFLYLLFGRDNRAAAAALLAVLGATDWVDGYIARHFHQVSTVGKVLDPVADRLLFFVGAGGILVDGSIPVWIAVAVLAREAVVGAGTIILAMLGARRIDVTWYGKAGTFGLMCVFPWFLASHSTLRIAPLFGVLAWIAVFPSLALSYYAAFQYIGIGRRALAEGRADRSRQAATA